MKIPFEAATQVRSLARVTALVVMICVVGTVGYKVIGGSAYTWVEAFFMTTVTLSTVGYREVVDLSGSPAGQLFTAVLLLFGVGTFLYLFSNLTAFMVEGTVDRLFWRRRMERKIAAASDHFVVCGGGTTGVHVIAELLETRRPFVLVERKDGQIDELYGKLGTEFPVVIGDATEDETLLAAGIERARGLVSCISSDKDNLVVAFAARNLCPDLRIVARCTTDQEIAKIRKAGADAVVSPDHIGGLRLVSELVRPTVVNFLDEMLREGDKLRIEEVAVARGSRLEGTTLGALRDRKLDLMVVAVRTSEGRWTYNPADTMELVAGTGLIFMGGPGARLELEAEATAR